jgi:hypothetical protein
MKKKNLLLLVFIGLAQFALAQMDKKIRFYSSQMFGITVGEVYVTGIAHCVNGVQYKQFNVGIGIGYDAYQLSKVPLYLDLRYTLLKKRIEPILFSHIGTSFLIRNYDQNYSNLSSPQTKLYKGFYNEIGLMLKTKVKGNLSYLVSMSYCYSTNSYLKHGLDYWGGGIHYVTEDVLYRYRSERVNFKIGFQF